MATDSEDAPVVERCGLAWTTHETSILYRLLERGGSITEAFSQIGRGEDAIKRKWRKVIDACSAFA